MLIGIHPLLSPDLLHALAAMGHGDEIAIVDANFPGTTCARRLIRMEGVSATAALEAVLTLLPLDSYVPHPANVMQVVGDAEAVPPAVADFTRIIGTRGKVGSVERFAFYERAKACFAIVQTGEGRLYGNVILTKGVIPA
ncbi:ribose ABC transporter [Pseudorhodobacter sp. E13]|uniref:RbsD/FucU family protein n=1 Tax=Pseudorhodobacter sp. E13 TaxID=2487931 RepID=UPI000F8EE2E7|nr:RbsD/FucU domain-containing protein [Pseudorhodobacter sp. E13]RUS60808.1 ribose ABC transporter [Pseudorhodobacter sp. E13]